MISPIHLLSRISIVQLLWTLGGLLVLRKIVGGCGEPSSRRSVHEAALKVFIVKSSEEDKPEALLKPIDIDHRVIRSPKAIVFPDVCDNESLTVQGSQLPDFRCVKTEKRIWNNHCSYSYATRCPDPQWLKPPTTAVLVDVCSEAQTRPVFRLLWRMTSDTTYDEMVKAWPLATPDYEENTSDKRGKCVIYPISAKVVALEPNENAKVHCISTSDVAGETARASTLQKAVAGLPDKMKRRFVIAKPQTEIEKYLTSLKEPVDFLRFGLKAPTPEFIHQHGSVLSSNVKYFEFVNHFSGDWENWFLSDIVEKLKKHRFVCYFAGGHGNVWRLTDCFLDYFDLRFWSNVACVNIDLDPGLLERMELMFKAVQERKYEIKFMNDNFIGTDGTRDALRI